MKFLFIIFFSLNCFALQNGDLVFIKSQTAQSQALRDATGSDWTHVGIYYNDKVYESTGTTSFDSFISRSKKRDYVIKTVPFFKDSSQFEISLLKYFKKPYDIYFEWSDDKIYCSEFVYKVFYDAFKKEIGTIQKFKDMNLQSKSVQDLIKSRYKNGKKFDENELIVTPISVLNHVDQ